MATSTTAAAAENEGSDHWLQAVHSECMPYVLLIISFSFSSSFVRSFVYLFRFALLSKWFICIQLIIHCSHFLLLPLLVLFCVAFATRVFSWTDYSVSIDFKLRSGSTKNPPISNSNGHQKKRRKNNYRQYMKLICWSCRHYYCCSWLLNWTYDEIIIISMAYISNKAKSSSHLTKWAKSGLILM